MMFNSIELFDYYKFISTKNDIFAHTRDDKNESLKEHLELTYKYFVKIVKAKKLSHIFKKFEEIFFANSNEESTELWYEMLCNTIYMHDLGKINGHFQYKIMHNEKYSKVPQIDNRHSMLSSCMYINYFGSKIKNLDEEAQKLPLTFVILNAYVISRHHSPLDDFGKFKNDVIDRFEFFKENEKLIIDYLGDFKLEEKEIKRYFKITERRLNSDDAEDKWKPIDIFIYVRFMYSLLVASDYYATSEFKNGIITDDFGLIEDVDKYSKIIEESDTFKNIQKYREFKDGKGTNPYKKNDINELRTEMFIETEKKLNESPDSNVFYLEAPTGAGKTIMSLNLAFKLLKANCNLNRIFYIFPFNTLVEQTKVSISNAFNNDPSIAKDVTVINSITPINVDEEVITKDDEKIKYEKAFLGRQFLHYPIILTTHINFFEHLFGTSKDEVFVLSQMANSVIIIDEIQSYRNKIWKEIVIFLNKYAQFLNLKIIIMSATLPKLDRISEVENNFTYLIKDRNKYFLNPLFKNRVSVDFSLIDYKGDIFEKLIEEVTSNINNKECKILVEFINKSSAMDFYKMLCSISKEKLNNARICIITGDDNKVERQRIIKLTKEQGSMILVSTQVVEAGVDIDMDIGYKDISILDAEEQFMGRINRSCKKTGCKVYFFNCDESSVVYRGDYRNNQVFTLKNEEFREILENKEFEKYYDIIMDRINEDLYKYNANNINDFIKDDVMKLNFIDIKNRMKLIEDNRKKYSLFLNTVICMETGEEISGEEVWKEYVDTIKDSTMSYAEQKVKLSYVLEKMDYFLYEVESVSIGYNDVLGSIFYIREGERYFTDGKFDRRKLKEADKFEFLQL